jgi:hypothetical protein
MTNQRSNAAPQFSRVATIDQRIDTTSGEFDMVMASEGEASDGHVIRIAGVDHPDTLPLQLDHARGAADNLGSVSNIRKGKRDGVPVLLGVGQIRMTGEGDGLAARLDLVDAIARGHITGTSMTWAADSQDVKERSTLPKGHPAAVDPLEPNLRRRFGLYFAKSRAIEQSVVAIPADRAAVIGRAEAAQDASARALWQVLAGRIEAATAVPADRYVDALTRALAAAEQRIRDAEPRRSSDLPPAVPPIDQVLARLAPTFGDVGGRTRRELDAALEAALNQLTGVFHG